MAGAFTDACQVILGATASHKTPRRIAISLPILLATDDFAATSLGFRDRAFFEQPNPEAFFPWWEEGATPRTLKNLALSKMWLEVFWGLRADAGGGEDLRIAQKLIDLARGHGAEFAKNDGVDDIAALLHGASPDPDGTGYWRQDTWRHDPNGWSVAVPAFFSQAVDKDGQLCAMTSGDREVRLRTVRYVEAQPLEWAPPPWPGSIEWLRFETEHYRAVVYHEPDDSLLQLWVALVNSRNGSAQVTVMFRDEDDAAWAEKVVRSVRPPSATEAETIDDTVWPR